MCTRKRAHGASGAETMRIGLIGPVASDLANLRSAITTLFVEAGVDRAVYLGSDGALDVLAKEWTSSLGGPTGLAFDDRALDLAVSGSATEIRELLAADANARRLERLASLPPPPSQALEMLDDRFLLFTHDTSTLDEDDIANAQVIIYGVAKQMLFRRFGPRAFFTPGPPSEGHLGIVETDFDGRLTITAMKSDGSIALRESLASRSNRMSVAR